MGRCSEMATKKISILATLLVLTVATAGCATADLLQPVHRLGSFRFVRGSPLMSRMSAPPPVVLGHLRRLDRRDDYEPYIPDRNETLEMERAFTLLPVRSRNVLNDRLIGIYFISNFTGNGLCEWVMDSDGKAYVFFVFNPSSFSKNMSQLLTEKENTCFADDDISIDITVDCGKKYSGFAYILLHESAHAVDYVLNVTPYVDEEHGEHMKKKTAETMFTKYYWSGYDAPTRHFMFTGKVSFYGSGERKLKRSNAVEAYQDLSRSPFVSLYASMSWAEDLAELAAFYHITRVLKQPFGIRVLQNKKTIFSTYPMEHPEIAKRLRLLKLFYASEGI
jgi:hypothetical protein